VEACYPRKERQYSLTRVVKGQNGMKLIEMVGLILRRGMESEDWDQTEEEIVESMLFQGYDVNEINMAISVAQRLREQVERRQFVGRPPQSNRIFEFLEQIRLTPKARGYLLTLIHSGAITPMQREEIVEKTLFIDAPEIGLEEIQYVTQMVLAGEDFTQEPNDEQQSGWYH
jgi:uncharacterized protein Smg (DUF494 family)